MDERLRELERAAEVGGEDDRWRFALEHVRALGRLPGATVLPPTPSVAEAADRARWWARRDDRETWWNVRVVAGVRYRRESINSQRALFDTVAIDPHHPEGVRLFTHFRAFAPAGRESNIAGGSGTLEDVVADMEEQVRRGLGHLVARSRVGFAGEAGIVALPEPPPDPLPRLVLPPSAQRFPPVPSFDQTFRRGEKINFRFRSTGR